MVMVTIIHIGRSVLFSGRVKLATVVNKPVLSLTPLIVNTITICLIMMMVMIIIIIINIFTIKTAVVNKPEGSYAKPGTPILQLQSIISTIIIVIICDHHHPHPHYHCHYL